MYESIVQNQRLVEVGGDVDGAVGCRVVPRRSARHAEGTC